MAVTVVFEVTLSYVWGGQMMQNVLHFTGPSTDEAQRSALAQEVIDSWIGVVRFRQNRNVKYVNVAVRMLESQFDTFNQTVSIAGLATADAANLPVTAHILRKYTNIQGRHGRGRNYIGGLPEATFDNGFMSQNEQNQWTTAIGQIMGVFGPSGTSNFRLGLIAKVGAPTNTFLHVVRLAVSPTVGVQRRRNMGVGI